MGQIERKKVIDTVKNTRKFCDTDNIDDFYDLLIEAFEVLPSAEPERMRDPIERQAAIEALNRCTDIYYTNLPPLVDKEEVRRALESLPSAPAEPHYCREFYRYG